MKKVTTPFMNCAHETLESLKKCKFMVRENKSGSGYSVFMKNIIAVGPLPTKAYAHAIAADFNDFVETRIGLIADALRVSEEKIKDVLTDSEKDVGEAISYYADNYVRGDSVSASEEASESLVSKRDGKVFVHGGGKFTKTGMQPGWTSDNIETPKVDK